jgi:tetratricopeptide (TPR) repeat protein
VKPVIIQSRTNLSVKTQRTTLFIFLIINLGGNLLQAAGFKPVDRTIPANLPANIFNIIYLTPAEKRVVTATDIYKKNCRKTPAIQAMKSLDLLNTIAIKLNDKTLQCKVYALRADYYSVNNNFNTTSLNYYQKAITFAKQNNMALETAISMHDMAMYYYVFKRNVAAYPYFLQAQDKFREIGLDKVPGISGYLNDVAVFYYNLGDFYNAKLQLTEALKYKTYSKRDQINMINTIGLIYRRDKQFPQALTYFNSSLRLAKIYKDSAWIGIATGNIGSVYVMQNNYNKALPYVRTDYNVSLKYGESDNAAIAMLRIAKISMEANKVETALKQLDTVKSLINNHLGVLNQWIDYYNLKAIGYERTGNFIEAMNCRKKFEYSKDSLFTINNIAAIERLHLRRLMDTHLAQVNQLKSDQAIGNVKRNAVIAVLFLLMIIFILVYNRQLLKEKKDKELLKIEKRRVDDELKSSITELSLFTENLKQKNQLIEKFKTKVKSLQDNKVAEDVLEKLMPVNIMTDENWDEFRKLFIKVHTGFFLDLKKKCPNISGTDTRLLALMKLHLNNREMANMLGITLEGIKKAKQRLRKKMNLPKEETIENFITEL